MRCNPYRLIAGLILGAPCFAGGIAADTARMAAHLERFRHYNFYEIQSAEFKAIQREYLSWIDSRLKTGASTARMNDELRTAKLLSNGPENVDDEDKTYAGFLGEIAVRSTGAAQDLFAITFGIHTGGSCNFDETVALYGRKPLRRVAQINAERSYTHGYRLREVVVGNNGPSGRKIASAWVASNCTSNWNGNILRIDVLTDHSLDNVLDRGASAFGADEVKISVDDTVTFRYTSSMGDPDVLTRPGIARYRVRGGRAIREAPIATSFGGFIDEWLEMDDAEAARWSTPEAGNRHHDLAARKSTGLLKWEHAAACPGPPPAREISIRWSESKQLTVFQVTDAPAADLRMLSISDHRSPLCREIDISGGLSSIVAEPAQ